jgi:histidyl-tRNA synthetase
VCYTDPSLENKALKLSTILRGDDKRVSLLYGATRIKKALQFALNVNAIKLAILDPREVSDGKYIVKNLLTSEQVLVDL